MGHDGREENPAPEGCPRERRGKITRKKNRRDGRAGSSGGPGTRIIFTGPWNPPGVVPMRPPATCFEYWPWYSVVKMQESGTEPERVRGDRAGTYGEKPGSGAHLPCRHPPPDCGVVRACQRQICEDKMYLPDPPHLEKGIASRILHGAGRPFAGFHNAFVTSSVTPGPRW